MSREVCFLQKKISYLLPFARIEHIGASSIPGVISKGDLDIFIGVSGDKFESSLPILKSLGFSEKMNTFRTSELCMLESDKEDVAFQVVENGSVFEYFITFRDILRNNSVLISKYNNLKISCKGMGHEKYREIKSEFIENVLSGSVANLFLE